MSQEIKEQTPLSKWVSASPRTAIKYLQQGNVLFVDYRYGSRFVYMYHKTDTPRIQNDALFPNNIFNALKELDLIKEQSDDVWVWKGDL